VGSEPPDIPTRQLFPVFLQLLGILVDPRLAHRRPLMVWFGRLVKFTIRAFTAKACGFVGSPCPQRAGVGTGPPSGCSGQPAVRGRQKRQLVHVTRWSISWGQTRTPPKERSRCRRSG